MTLRPRERSPCATRGTARSPPPPAPSSRRSARRPPDVRWPYCRTRYRGGLLMRSVTYSMGVSLDGYIVGPDGGFGWTAPDEEVFRFVTDEIRQVGVHLLGRRLYETMLYWETADQNPSLSDSLLEWAAIWKPLATVGFSSPVEWAGPPAEASGLGLIDEAGGRACPVLDGGGVAFFSLREQRVNLELL